MPSYPVSQKLHWLHLSKYFTYFPASLFILQQYWTWLSLLTVQVFASLHPLLIWTLLRTRGKWEVGGGMVVSQYCFGGPHWPPLCPCPGSLLVSCLLASLLKCEYPCWSTVSHLGHSQDHLPYGLSPPLCLPISVLLSSPLQQSWEVARLLAILSALLLCSPQTCGKLHVVCILQGCHDAGGRWAQAFPVLNHFDKSLGCVAA